MKITQSIRLTMHCGTSEQSLLSKITLLLESYDCYAVRRAQNGSLIFERNSANGPLVFRIDPDVSAILATLHSDQLTTSAYRTHEQAIRAKYRLLLEWLESSLSMVAVGAIEFERLFMPFAIIAGDPQDRTVYEAAASQVLKEVIKP